MAGVSQNGAHPWEELMNLESKWLEDFSALAATRSFSQAAERRFVTQPAFSRRIRSLEAALGLTLVNRSRTPVELTAAGQLFLVTARTVVEQLGEVLRHLHHLEGGQGEVMQVAAAHSLALGFFPRWIAQLRNEGLNIATRLVATNVGDADGSGDLPVTAPGQYRNAPGVRRRCRGQAIVRPGR